MESQLQPDSLATNTARQDTPGMVGVFPSSDGIVPVVPRKEASLWPARPVLWTSGEWRHGEFRTVTGLSGYVAVMGQCMVDDQRFAADAQRALESGRWEPLTRWPGSYLTIMVRENELTAFADLAGQYPLYYTHVGGRTVFGSHAGATATAAGLVNRPDSITVAAQTFCPTATVLTDGRSVFSGVSRLGGGQALSVARDGTPRRWTYETLAPNAETSLSDGAHALRSALDDAVRDRVHSRQHLTADFSGGQDSTSVAFLAARHRTCPLPVFTYHHPGAPAGDLEYAERYALLDRRMSLEVVLGNADTLTYRELPSLAVDVPDPAAVSWPRTRLRLKRIADTGTGVHLNGEGADALLVAPPAYLADLASRGMLRRLSRDASILARRHCESPATVLAKSVRLATTSMGSALHQLANQLERPVDRSTRWLDAISWWPALGAEGTWLTRSMRRQLAELARATAPIASPADGLGIGDFAALGELRASGAVQRQLSETARSFSVWPQAPFLDNDVLRACTKVPAHRRADPTTIKPLLRHAMSGLVPDQVFTRRTKGNYSGEDYHGARLALSELKAHIARSRLADLGVIEPGAVIASLDQVRTGAAVPIPALNRLLGADLWLEGWAEVRSHR